MGEMMEDNEGGKPTPVKIHTPISHTGSSNTVTIKKDHFYGILMILLLFVGFGGGYIIGDKFGDGSGGGTPVPPSPGPIPPAPPPAPGAKVAVDVGAAYALGDEDAPVTIVEFSDFQCPFCSRHFSQTQPQLQQNYIDTGKVVYYFKNLPLSFHPMADPAAQAAECAGKQGSFWEYHDYVFENQQTLSEENLKVWASDLGLDTGQFNECYDSKEFNDKIQADLAQAQQLGASGTPTFFIGNPEDGYVKIVGAQPYATFQAAIEAELA